MIIAFNPSSASVAANTAAVVPGGSASDRTAVTFLSTNTGGLSLMSSTFSVSIAVPVSGSNPPSTAYSVNWYAPTVSRSSCPTRVILAVKALITRTESEGSIL